MLVCQTSPQPNAAAEYYGGRGITIYIDNFYTSSLSGATPSLNATMDQLESASYVDDSGTNSPKTVWLKGFFAPAKTSRYSFSIQTSGQAIFYLSSDATSANKVTSYFWVMTKNFLILITQVNIK